jgi:hypothetical protein
LDSADNEIDYNIKLTLKNDLYNRTQTLTEHNIKLNINYEVPETVKKAADAPVVVQIEETYVPQEVEKDEEIVFSTMSELAEEDLVAKSAPKAERGEVALGAKKDPSVTFADQKALLESSNNAIADAENAAFMKSMEEQRRLRELSEAAGPMIMSI